MKGIFAHSLKILGAPAIMLGATSNTHDIIFHWLGFKGENG